MYYLIWVYGIVVVAPESMCLKYGKTHSKDVLNREMFASRLFCPLV